MTLEGFEVIKIKQISLCWNMVLRSQYSHTRGKGSQEPMWLSLVSKTCLNSVGFESFDKIQATIVPTTYHLQLDQLAAEQKKHKKLVKAYKLSSAFEAFDCRKFFKLYLAVKRPTLQLHFYRFRWHKLLSYRCYYSIARSSQIQIVNSIGFWC